MGKPKHTVAMLLLSSRKRASTCTKANTRPSKAAASHEEGPE